MIDGNLSMKTEFFGLNKADVNEYLEGIEKEYVKALSQLQKERKLLERTKNKLLIELEAAKAGSQQVVYEDEPADPTLPLPEEFTDNVGKRLNKTVALIDQIAEQKIEEMVQRAAVRLEEYDVELDRLKCEIDENREKIEQLLTDVVGLLKTNIEDLTDSRQVGAAAAKKTDSPKQITGKQRNNQAEETQTADSENVIDFFDAKKRGKPALSLVSKDVETAVIKSLETYRGVEGEFTNQLQRLIASEQSGAVLLLQFNEFIMANYFLNSSTGDVLMNIITRQLNEMESGLYVERLSYDQIGMIYNGMSDKSRLSKFANDVLEYIHKNMFVEDKKIDLSANMGIALYTTDTDNAELVMNYVGIALFKAKEQGKGNYQFIDDELISKVKFSNDLKSDLIQAIENNELALFYQPQYEITNNELMGFEALLRWKNPKYYRMSIQDVIRVAEKENLIGEIGIYLFRNACRFAKEVEKRSHKRIVVSVNFSTMQVRQEDFISTIRAVMQETGVSPAYLGFEITESCFIECVEETCNKLQEIKNMGITISIDDFGTGYSTLSYLLKLPISIIKIDKTFLDELTTSKRAEMFIGSIITIAHNLNLRVVAEGVENERQYEILKSLGCDYLQGFYLAKPTPEEEAYLYLKN